MAKACVISKDILWKATAYLNNEINDKDIRDIPKDIRNFLSESSNLKDMQKRFSQERVLKLKGALLSFLSIHSIEKDANIDYIIKQFDTIVFSSDASAFFAQCFDIVHGLLHNYKFRNFDESRVYFIDDNAKIQFSSLREKLESLIRTQTEKKKLKFSKIINFINEEEVATQYSVVFRKKYQYISTPASIEKYLPQHYAIIKNKVEKDYKDLIGSHNFPKSKIKLLLDQKRDDLKKIDSEYDFIQNTIKSGDDIDIKILSYEHSSQYPEIRYKCNGNEKNKKKTRYAHLKSETINVLWYNPIQVKTSSTISDIIENYNHAFGDVYYSHGVSNKKVGK